METEELFIRPVETRDAPSIARIVRRLGWFDHLTGLSKNEQTEQVMHVIAEFQRDPNQTALVADIDQRKVVGYVSAHWRSCFFLPRREGYVAELFVEARYRGRQIGWRLLDTITREALKRGCSRMTVTHNRLRESYRRGFYRCRGWSERPEMAQMTYPLWSLAD
jgi:GNAT superfamily N-acetyltransferase